MIVKIPAILGCLFLTLAAVIIAVTGPAHGYEISIYNAYPAFFWLLILLRLGFGLVILVGQAFANESSNPWVTGFVILLLTNMLLFLLPFFRQHLVYGRADVLTNIGYVKDILLTGHITAVGDQLVDIYPALHILAACVSDITMLSPEQVAILSVPLAVIFYMVSLYFLSRIVCRNRSQILLAISFGSLPLFTGAYVFFIPIDITFFLLPLTLLLFFRAYKGKTIRSRVALLIALISAVIFHPIEGAILTLVILTCFGISSNIYSVFLGKTKHKIATLNYWYLYVIILVVADAIWSFRFSVLTGHISRLVSEILSAAGQTVSSLYFGMLGKVQMSFYNAFELFMHMYGQDVIFFTFALFFSFQTVKLAWSKRDVSESRLAFSVIFGAMIVLTVTFFFLPIGSFDFSRGILYGTFASVILVGICVGEQVDTLKLKKSLRFLSGKKLLMVFTIVVLLLSATFGIMNEYHSPLVREANEQITKTDLQGMTWFLSYQNDLLVLNIAVTQWRYAGEIKGVEAIPYNIKGGGLPSEYQPPDHFGYTNGSLLGQFYTENKYFIDNKLSEEVYPGVYPEYQSLWRYTKSDFEMLNNDNTVNRVYSNGYFMVYYVYSDKGVPAPT